MTITEMVDYYDLLQDKYGSPYFTTSEKERFLNQAQLDIISDHLPKEGTEQNIERNANSWLAFNTLFFSTVAVMNSLGVITKTDLESTLTTALGFTVTIIRPLSFSWTDSNGTRPIIGPTRQNNWAKFIDNIFKIPVESEPRYYESNSSYVINPVNTGASITITGLRYPKAISVSGTQTSELSPLYHNEVVARALELAGVSSRDQALVELQKINQI